MNPVTQDDKLADWHLIKQQLDRWKLPETKPDGTPLNLYGRLLLAFSMEARDVLDLHSVPALLEAASSAADWLEDADPGSDPKERGDELRKAIQKVRGEE